MKSCIALLALDACQRIPQNDFHSQGVVVDFNVTTGYEPATRTSFSGEISGTTVKHERIDWTVGDEFRVYSPNAGTSALAHFADYVVTSFSADYGRSVAMVTCPDPLTWSSGTNTFYGFYPAPKTGASANGAMMNENVVSGSILSAQSVTRTSSGSTVYTADLANHGYMYAISSGAFEVASSVALVFRPLMTAFEIRLRNSSAAPVSSNLKKVTVRSASSWLSGDFSALLSTSDFFPSVSVENNDNRSKEVSVSFGTEGIPFPTDSDLKVTLLGLPVDQEQLTLELSFADGYTRTLPLKTGSDWITVPAGRKLYVVASSVPGMVTVYIEGSDIAWDLSFYGPDVIWDN